MQHVHSHLLEYLNVTQFLLTLVYVSVHTSRRRAEEEREPEDIAEAAEDMDLRYVCCLVCGSRVNVHSFVYILR